MKKRSFEVVAIGGSAGSMPVVRELLESMPGPLRFTVIIILHRLKNVHSEMARLLSVGLKGFRVREPDDKEPLKERSAYLVPQNYHLLIEADKTVCLDYSEPVHHSRPSIDVTFESVARVYAGRAVAILLSGASRDGADGLFAVIANGGVGIVQDPATAEYQTMPQAAITRTDRALVMKPGEIAAYLQTLNG
ncbi:chemotaxis protein CheB [Larkinella soli]|uniref:chemotaxis protein CheB n=1 Tax=Larkinella soli TaxID=1770527 RepID=UPI000FFC6B82|nr:chemotaxis protein CheB [Larkinella soli]